MSFVKIKSGKNRGKYRSPSGRIYTARQVKYYYASSGFKRPPQKRRQRKKK